MQIIYRIFLSIHLDKFFMIVRMLGGDSGYAALCDGTCNVLAQQRCFSMMEGEFDVAQTCDNVPMVQDCIMSLECDDDVNANLARLVEQCGACDTAMVNDQCRVPENTFG